MEQKIKCYNCGFSETIHTNQSFCKFTCTCGQITFYDFRRDSNDKTSKIHILKVSQKKQNSKGT
ncbi:MAG: hypothetical protein Hyperionvirus3_179 [Hyperionvirus sp.]|uniref:Uncharacterized protein n=1 Tax=Hyperionvirus sp. TaxID=2487770 RepID=A0A3G5AB23_9VIRU|nr:MAG: hypothetical protein Hyperionvirus3_179 [Hyperionvirus sp.]